MESEGRRPELSPPVAVHRLDDERSGLRAFVVLHDLTLGPAFGGIRFRGYRDDDSAREDAIGLARQMSWKCALAGLAGGGGKAVVRADLLTDRRAACGILGDFIESLGGRFRTAGDLGATRTDLEMIATRTNYIVDPGSLDELGDAVAIGLVAAMEVIAHRLGRSDLAALRVVVQGLGDIGMPLVRRLAMKGCRPLVADLDEAAVRRAVSIEGVTAIPPADVTRTPADVLAPCAVGGVIGEDVARTLPVRAVAGGANRILASAKAGTILWERGILYAPDFLVNSGAVIRGGLEMLRGTAGREDEILLIGPRLADLLEESQRRGIQPELVAAEKAEKLIREGRCSSLHGRKGSR